MSDGAPHQRPDFPTRALGVVAGGALLHFLGSTSLVALLEADPMPGQRGALSLSVLFTALVAVALLYVRTQYSTPQHAARSIPWVFYASPPAVLAATVPMVFPPAVVESGWPALLPATLPVVAACWSVALLVGLVVDRILRQLAARVPADETSLFPARTFAPASLGQSLGRVMVVVGFSSALVAIAVAGSDLLDGADLLRTVATGAGLLVLLLLGAIAGESLGHSLGEDIVSIAERLDTLGYGPAQGALASPVVVTRNDEVGELLARLEELRAHLVREMELYQQALDKTKAADALKSDFLSAVSHELRTPLNAVGGFAQLLLESKELNRAQSEDVRLIQAGGRQLLDLINDILDMSMIESGELRLTYGATNVAEVIEEVVRIHQPLVHDRPVVLRATFGPDLPDVVCDRRRLTQILTNLVSNAVKFTESGTITVRCAYDPRMNGVVIRCIDTGVGIDATDLVHIFEEYRQVGSIKRRKKGTGLGLAIARRIAQAHGGQLTVQSTPREGSTFTLTLPVEPPSRPLSIDMAEETARILLQAQQRESAIP